MRRGGKVKVHISIRLERHQIRPQRNNSWLLSVENQHSSSCIQGRLHRQTSPLFHKLLLVLMAGEAAVMWPEPNHNFHKPEFTGNWNHSRKSQCCTIGKMDWKENIVDSITKTFIVYSALEVHFGWYSGRIPWGEVSGHVQTCSRSTMLVDEMRFKYFRMVPHQFTDFV